MEWCVWGVRVACSSNCSAILCIDRGRCFVHVHAPIPAPLPPPPPPAGSSMMAPAAFVVHMLWLALLQLALLLAFKALKGGWGGAGRGGRDRRGCGRTLSRTLGPHLEQIFPRLSPPCTLLPAEWRTGRPLSFGGQHDAAAGAAAVHAHARLPASDSLEESCQLDLHPAVEPFGSSVIELSAAGGLMPPAMHKAFAYSH